VSTGCLTRLNTQAFRPRRGTYTLRAWWHHRFVPWASRKHQRLRRVERWPARGGRGNCVRGSRN